MEKSPNRGSSLFERGYCMEEQAIGILEHYMDIQLSAPNRSMDPDLFDMQVYSRWAAEEIIERLMSEAMKLPPHISGHMYLSASEIITDFIEEMDAYAKISKDERTKKIFSFAREEGRTILLYLRSIK